MTSKIKNQQRETLKDDNNLIRRNLSNKEKVDINILLNRVRLDDKKKKLKNILYFSLVSISLLFVGIFLSV